jgi:hypothetical protein
MPPFLLIKLSRLEQAEAMKYTTRALAAVPDNAPHYPEAQ